MIIWSIGRLAQSQFMKKSNFILVLNGQMMSYAMFVEQMGAII
jgi:hypothetical protein